MSYPIRPDHFPDNLQGRRQYADALSQTESVSANEDPCPEIPRDIYSKESIPENRELKDFSIQRTLPCHDEFVGEVTTPVVMTTSEDERILDCRLLSSKDLLMPVYSQFRDLPAVLSIALERASREILENIVTCTNHTSDAGKFMDYYPQLRALSLAITDPELPFRTLAELGKKLDAAFSEEHQRPYPSACLSGERPRRQKHSSLRCQSFANVNFPGNTHLGAGQNVSVPMHPKRWADDQAASNSDLIRVLDEELKIHLDLDRHVLFPMFVPSTVANYIFLNHGFVDGVTSFNPLHGGVTHLIQQLIFSKEGMMSTELHRWLINSGAWGFMFDEDTIENAAFIKVGHYINSNQDKKRSYVVSGLHEKLTLNNPFGLHDYLIHGAYSDTVDQVLATHNPEQIAWMVTHVFKNSECDPTHHRDYLVQMRDQLRCLETWVVRTEAKEQHNLLTTVNAREEEWVEDDAWHSANFAPPCQKIRDSRTPIIRQHLARGDVVMNVFRDAEKQAHCFRRVTELEDIVEERGYIVVPVKKGEDKEEVYQALGYEGLAIPVQHNSPDIAKLQDAGGPTEDKDIDFTRTPLEPYCTASAKGRELRRLLSFQIFNQAELLVRKMKLNSKAGVMGDTAGLITKLGALRDPASLAMGLMKFGMNLSKEEGFSTDSIIRYAEQQSGQRFPQALGDRPELVMQLAETAYGPSVDQTGLCPPHQGRDIIRLSLLKIAGVLDANLMELLQKSGDIGWLNSDSDPGKSWSGQLPCRGYNSERWTINGCIGLDALYDHLDNDLFQTIIIDLASLQPDGFSAQWTDEDLKTYAAEAQTWLKKFAIDRADADIPDPATAAKQHFHEGKEVKIMHEQEGGSCLKTVLNEVEIFEGGSFLLLDNPAPLQST